MTADFITAHDHKLNLRVERRLLRADLGHQTPRSSLPWVSAFSYLSPLRPKDKE